MKFIFLLIISVSLVVHAESELSIKEQAKSNYNREYYSQLLIQGLSLVPFLIGIAAAKRFYEKANPQPPIPMDSNWVPPVISLKMKVIAGIATSIFSEMMIAQALSKPMLSGFRSCAQWLVSWIPYAIPTEGQNPMDALLIEFERLKIEYQENKCQLSKDTQILFEKLEGQVATTKMYIAAYGLTGETANDFLKKQLVPILLVMRTLLELPQKKQPLILTEDLKTKLRPILKRYSPAIQENIKDFTISIVDSSVMSGVAQPVLYLLGEPGTGKTTFVELYAEAMGLPLIRTLDLQKFLEVKEPLFLGDSISESFLLSAFTETLRNKPKNVILFLDELEKSLNKQSSPGAMQMGMQSVNLESFLHQLLDPNEKTIELPDLKISIDKSSFIIIVAGNAKLLSSSLNNRMARISFPCIESEKRPEIAQKRFRKGMAARLNLEHSEQDDEMIRQIAVYGPRCGVRSMEFVVDAYVTWKRKQQVNWEPSDAVSNTTQSKDFNITEEFEMHPE
ncbi:MAG: AAA family ATPase [Myxococcaceae bacterium]